MRSPDYRKTSQDDNNWADDLTARLDAPPSGAGSVARAAASGTKWIAVSQAIRSALEQAGGKVLRPLMRIEVVVPDENMGTVLGDLQSRGAVISGTESEMDATTIHGECPLHALLGYATDLRSITRGRGQFTMEFDRFDVA